jgi:hypothetical protein
MSPQTIPSEGDGTLEKPCAGSLRRAPFYPQTDFAIDSSSLQESSEIMRGVCARGGVTCLGILKNVTKTSLVAEKWQLPRIAPSQERRSEISQIIGIGLPPT